MALHQLASNLFGDGSRHYLRISSTKSYANGVLNIDKEADLGNGIANEWNINIIVVNKAQQNVMKDSNIE